MDPTVWYGHVIFLQSAVVCILSCKSSFTPSFQLDCVALSVWITSLLWSVWRVLRPSQQTLVGCPARAPEKLPDAWILSAELSPRRGWTHKGHGAEPRDLGALSLAGSTEDSGKAAWFPPTYHLTGRALHGEWRDLGCCSWTSGR